MTNDELIILQHDKLINLIHLCVNIYAYIQINQHMYKMFQKTCATLKRECIF